MKKINFCAILCSVLILAAGCSIGIVSVSALSAEGEIILSELASAGTSLGIDIGAFVTTTEENTTGQTEASADALDRVDSVLSSLGIGSDVLVITDLIRYLNQGNSFGDWIYENYGDSVEIPESVRGMSANELVVFLMGKLLYTETTTAQERPGYTSLSTENQPTALPSAANTSSVTDEGRQDATVAEPTAGTTAVHDFDAAPSYKVGDVNSDGKVTSQDARLTLRAASKLDVLSGTAFAAADVNDDGVITAKDARSILRYSAKITIGF